MAARVLAEIDNGPTTIVRVAGTIDDLARYRIRPARLVEAGALSPHEIMVTGTVSKMAKEQPNYFDRIEQDPEIMVGKPVVRGTRIPVERVLAHLEENDRADLFVAFPELTEEDVRACLRCSPLPTESNAS